MNWTLIFSFFRTLDLDHLERSLYSLSKQTVQPRKLIFFDNNSPWRESDIRHIICQHYGRESWELYFAKHGNNNKTLSWANNQAIRLCETETFMFCRADFIYDFNFCERMLQAYNGNPMNYATSWMYQMNYTLPDSDTVDLESFNWREDPKDLLANTRGSLEEKATHCDGPSFCTSKKAMEAGGWYDETLIGWGFDQQDLQRFMVRNGVQMVVIPEFLYFHMQHGVDAGQRDLDRAKEVWLKSPRRQIDIADDLKRIAAAAEGNPT